MDPCSVYMQKDCSYVSKLAKFECIFLLKVRILSPEFSNDYESVAFSKSEMLNRINNNVFEKNKQIQVWIWMKLISILRKNGGRMSFFFSCQNQFILHWLCWLRLCHLYECEMLLTNVLKKLMWDARWMWNATENNKCCVSSTRIQKTRKDSGKLEPFIIYHTSYSMLHQYNKWIV